MNRTLASVLAVIITVAIVVVTAASVYTAIQTRDSAREQVQIRRAIDRVPGLGG